MPLMALAGALALDGLHRRRRLWSLALVVLTVGFLHSFRLPALDWEMLRHSGIDRTFRSRNGTLVMCEMLDRRLPAEARLLFMFENRTLGLPRERWVETLYEAPSSLELIRGSENAEQAAAKLRALGFSHVVMNWHNANAYYFGQPAAVTSQVHPREVFDREKQVVEELLKRRSTHLFELGGWSVYALPPA